MRCFVQIALFAAALVVVPAARPSADAQVAPQFSSSWLYVPANERSYPEGISESRGPRTRSAST